MSIILGGSYAQAKFTENYFYAADAFGDVVGTAGQQFPGSSKISGVATLDYDRILLPGYDLRLSLNDTYRSDIWLGTFPSAILGQTARCMHRA